MKPYFLLHVSFAFLTIIVCSKAFYSVSRNGDQCQFWWSKDVTTLTRRPITRTSTTPHPSNESSLIGSLVNPIGYWIRKKIVESSVGGYVKLGFIRTFKLLCSFLPHKLELFRFYMLYYPVTLRAVNGTLIGLDMGCQNLHIETITYSKFHYVLYGRLDMSQLRIKYNVESNLAFLGSKVDWSLENGSYLDFTITVDQDARCFILADDIDLRLIINERNENYFCKGICKAAQRKLVCLVHKIIRQIVEITTWPGINGFLKKVLCFSFRSQD